MEGETPVLSERFQGGADQRRQAGLLFSPVLFSTTLDKRGPEPFPKPREDSRHARGRAA
jgi:hypothetical protein